VSAGRSAVAAVVSLAVAAAALLLAVRTVAAPWRVGGPSMEPTLIPGDCILVDRWTYRHRSPRRGEIVLLDGPSGEMWIKRIGEAADAREGLWVFGDNAANSLDSRQLGPVAESRCLGRVAFRYWPPSRAGRPGPSRAVSESPGINY
jgi:signal peptidase I